MIRVPARLLSAFYYKTRPERRPNNSTNIHKSLIFKKIPFIDDQWSFHAWDHIVNVDSIWSQLVHNFGNDNFKFDYSKFSKEKNTPPNSFDRKKSFKHPSSPFPSSLSPLIY